MHSFEQLRYIARTKGADSALVAEEAASALVDVAREPGALVMSCKRLLEFHGESAPMWWVVARVLGSADPVRAAYDAALALAGDETVEELVVAVPSQSTVAASLSQLTTSALFERPDLNCHFVGDTNALRRALSTFDETASGFVPGDVGSALLGATCVVIEARAASSSQFLLDDTAHRLSSEAALQGIQVLVAVGEGRVLPDVLFGHVVDASITKSGTSRTSEQWWDLEVGNWDDISFGFEGAREPVVCEASIAARVITAQGNRPWRLALSSPGCPVPSELVEWRPARNQ